MFAFIGSHRYAIFVCQKFVLNYQLLKCISEDTYKNQVVHGVVWKELNFDRFSLFVRYLFIEPLIGDSHSEVIRYSKY